MSDARTDPALARSVPGIVWAVRTAAVLALAVLIYQAVSAGQLVADPRVSLGPHGFGAYLTHLTAGLLALATVAHAYLSRTGPGRAPVWPAAVAVVAFGLGFWQAYLGSNGPVAVHVPVAVLLVAGTVWVAAWAFSPATRPS